jgi:multicomponent Na+:H+ antiporter subunit E
MSRATLRTLRSRAAARGWRTLTLRAAVLAAGWWILCEGEPIAIVLGSLIVVAALIAGLSLPPSPAPRWQPGGLLRFAAVFAAGSVRGGIDVARRALAWRVRIAPDVVRYALRLPEGTARELFLGTTSLMPGTLAITCEGSQVALHVIAVHRALPDELAALEATVARATGVRMEESRA